MTVSRSPCPRRAPASTRSTCSRPSSWTSPQYQELAGPEALARGGMRPFGMYHDDDILKVKESWDRCFLSGEVEWVDTRLYRPARRSSSG